MAGRLAEWRRRTAVFALLTLLFNIFTPLVTLAVQPAVEGSMSASTDSQTPPMMDCDKGGMPAMGMGTSKEPRPGKGLCDGFCPLCTIGASFDAVRSIHFAPTAEAWSALPVLLPTDSALPRRTIHAVPSAPRAPPLSI